MVKIALFHGPPSAKVMDQSCRNCGNTLSTDFCGVCGQAAYRQVTFRRLFRESLLRAFDLEDGFLHTLVALSVRPGEAIREYMRGRRKPFTNPVSYCFLLVTLYALAVNVLDVEISIPGVVEFNELERRVYHILHGLLAYLVFFILWPVAALQARLFRRSGFSVAETYAFSLFVFGQVNLASAAFAAFGWLGGVPGIASLMAIQFVYLVWAMSGFYGLARPPVLRGLAVSAANFVIANTLSLLIGNLIVAAGLLEPVESFLA